jgi:Phage Mu protein F like protein
MRPGVTAALASSAHQRAFATSELRHEAVATAALEAVMRRYVRGAVASFKYGRPVLAAATPEPEWRMPIPKDLMDQVAAQRDLEAVAKTHSDKVATTTMENMAMELGMAPDMWQPLLRGVIAGQAGMKIVTAPSELVKTMMESLQESYEAGHSIPRAGREMRKAGYERSRYFAERIARTELIGAVNASSLAAVTAGTNIPYKLWMATNDQRTRRTHREADGQTVPIDAAFSVGGHRLEYPGDPSGPGEEVIMCRCTLGYVDEPRGLSTIAGGTMAAVDDTTEPAEVVGAAWTGAIAFEGIDTGDGRIITPGALNWRELPIPLMAQPTSAHGFGDPGPATVAGRIETIERVGDQIIASGIFDTSDSGIEAERLVREGMLTGISIDLAINEGEVIPPEDPADELEAMFGGTLNVLDGTIMGATIVPFPAFENARIAIVAGGAMHLRYFRIVNDQMLATFWMPFAPFPAADAPAGGGGDDEGTPSDATDDAAEAISDITDAVNGWPGLNGQVVITIDGEDTTVPFPPATATGDEPGEAAAAAIREMDESFAKARLALRMALRERA